MDSKKMEQYRDELVFQLVLILVSALLMVGMLWWLHYPAWKKTALLMKLGRDVRSSSQKMGELSGQQLADVAQFVKSIHDWEREQRANSRDKRSSPRDHPEESN